MVLRTPSDVELPPRATLPSLPLEVKARIVQLAYEQDCNFEERVKEAAPVELDMGTLLSSKWHGRSTNALLLTNHEFSGLAAKYVFKVLNASRSQEDTFGLAVFPRHGHHFRELVLDEEASLAQVKQALILSGVFPHLHILVLSLDAVVLLLGRSLLPGASLDDGLDANRAAFRRCALRIDCVHLGGFSAAEATRILEVFPNLVELTLEEVESPLFAGASADDSKFLVEAVHRYGGLRVLRLDRLAGEVANEGPIDTAWREADWCSLESLGMLDVLLSCLHETDWTFIGLFSTRLRRLEVALDSATLDATTPQSSFPQLRHLTLRGLICNCELLVARLSTSPLQSITLGLGDLNDLDPPKDLIPVLNLHPALPKLSIFPWRDVRPSPTAVRDLRRYAQDRPLPLLLDFEGAHDPFVHPPAIASPTTSSERQERTENACDALEDVLRFGLARSARARLDGDYEGAEEMLPMVKGLGARLVVERD